MFFILYLLCRSGGATGVSCKGPDDRTVRNFRMEDKGAVMSIKFAPEYRILAIQRGSVRTFVDGIGKEFTMSPREKGCYGLALIIEQVDCGVD